PGARGLPPELTTPEESTDLGKRHTMLTPRTSLLVLESWWDYEMYGIDMPEDVAAEKARQLAQRPAPQRAMQPPENHGPAAWFVKGSTTDASGTVLPGVTVTRTGDGLAPGTA